MLKKILSRTLPYIFVFGFYISDMFSIVFPGAPESTPLIFKGIFYGLAAGWLIWRGMICKAGFPKIGIEKGILAFGAVFLLEMFFTPEPRQAWPVLASMLRFAFLFYLLLDFSEKQADHAAFLNAMLTLSAILMALTLVETYAAYVNFWNATGEYINPPFPYRFKSMHLHANAMMAYTNLFAPLALVTFVKPRNRVSIILGAVYLILYIMCLPFSSSRAGWLGAATWIGLMALYWIIQNGWLKRLFLIKARSRIIIGFGMVIVISATIFLGLFFLNTFASHPSHGNNIFGGRSGIWSIVFQNFTDNPILGTGAGMIGLENLETAKSVPPDFWVTQAHSWFFQVLIEFGCAGLIVFFLLLGSIMYQLWRNFQRAPAEQRLQVFCVLACAAAWLVQSIFDDLTIWQTVVNQMLLLLVWAFSFDTPIPRAPRWTLNWLWVPLALFAGWALWNTWAAVPADWAAQAARKGDWQAAEQYAEEAVKRDPLLRYTHDLHAFTLAWSSAQTGDTAALTKAAGELDYVADTPESPALWLADLAVMEWQNGNRETAITHLQEAIVKAPNEPTFYLNLGVMQEQYGHTQVSLQAYCDALDLQPAWENHPFWDTTAVRQEAVQTCSIPEIKAMFWWQQAQQAIQQGDLETAALNLARSDWAKEPEMARGITRGLLLEAKGDSLGAVSAWEGALSLAAVPILEDGGNFAVNYAGYFGRTGLPVDLVPGYVQLQQDAGQFMVMDKLAEKYRVNGEANRLAWVMALFEETVYGQVWVYSMME